MIGKRQGIAGQGIVSLLFRSRTRRFAGSRLAAIAAALCCCAGVHAAIIHVPGDYPTIQQAIDAAADGDEIVIAAGLYPESIDLLGKSLVLEGIDGPKATTIDAGGLNNSSVLIAGSKEATLRGLTITGGDALTGGIVIDGGGALVENCIIAGNIGSGDGGGMRVINGASASFVGCTFADNVAGGNGGAGHVDATSIATFAHCDFLGNTAAGGGALDINCRRESTIVHCSFDKNISLGSGGAMRITESPLQIDHCAFSDNHAESNPDAASGGDLLHGGGAVVIRSAAVTIANSSFIGNTSSVFDDGRADGGAILNLSARDSEVTIKDSTFESNSVGGGLCSGGAIFSYRVEASEGPTQILRCTFTGNTAFGILGVPNAYGTGGAVYLFDDVASVLDSDFVGNKADQVGAMVAGGSSDGQGEILVHGCEFHANEADFHVGAVLCGNSVLMRRCEFIGNKAKHFLAGAVRLAGSSRPAIIEQCTFIDNDASQGGAIGASGSLAIGTTIRNCTFDHNTSDYGGAIHFQLSNSNYVVNIRDSDFRHNHATRNGGAIDMRHQTRVWIQNCNFESNTAHDELFPHLSAGGAIYASTDAHHYSTLMNSVFVNNVSYDGGAMRATTFNIGHSTFTSNISHRNGGALWLGSTNLANCTIVDNHAGELGGGAYVLGGAWFSNMTFSGNTAGTEGGGLFTQFASFLQNVIICGNGPDDLVGPYNDDGGNLVNGKCQPPTVRHVPAEHTTIQNAIDASQHGDEIIVASGTYYEALHMDGKNLRLVAPDGPQQTKIDASGLGERAITTGLTGIGASIEGFAITGGFGGGVRVSQNGSLRLVNCFIYGNTEQVGAGIWASSHPSAPGFVEVIDCRFEDNHAQHGGGLLANLTSSRIVATVFVNNTATDRGGAAALRSDLPLSVEHCTFGHNSAVNTGGAIHILGSAGDGLDVTSSEFRHNTAPQGGAIHFALDDELTITDTLFCSNADDDVFGEFTDLGGNTFLDDCPPLCLGDINGDGAVDVSDLLMLLGAWGPCPGVPGCAGDLNSDGFVDLADLLMLLADWGECPAGP